jgi:hypothetical protein
MTTCSKSTDSQDSISASSSEEIGSDGGSEAMLDGDVSSATINRIMEEAREMFPSQEDLSEGESQMDLDENDKKSEDEDSEGESETEE